MHGDDIWSAWIETPPGGAPVVRAARLRGDGTEAVAARTVGNASVDTWNLNAALDDSGNLLLVYDTRDGTRAKELRLLRVGAQSQSQVQLSSDDGHDSEYPDIAWHAGNVALTWFDRRDGNAEVYLLVGREADLSRNVDARARRITRTAGDSIGAYVAWNGPRGALAWSESDAGQQEIHLQSFDSRGELVGEARRLTHTSTASLIPSIRAWHRGFAIAWNERLAQESAASGHAPTLSSTATLEVIP